ncbi:MAG: helix-turn-helix domain-containing protein [Patescibacteria group bacterium]
MTYISVKEAAKLAGKNERTIRRWIKSGKVKHVIIRGKYHLTEESLDIFKVDIEEGSDRKGERKVIRSSRKINSLKDTDSHKKNEIDQDNKSSIVKNVSENMSVQSFDNVRKFNTSKQKENTTRSVNISPTVLFEKGNPVMEEGVEYFLDKNMSERIKNNMSVNKIDKDYFGPLVSSNHTVEMSENTNFALSNFSLPSVHDSLQARTDGLVSDFKTGLSTNSDSVVDKLFDVNDKIVSYRENNFGQSDKYSGHLDRTLGMSAFAVRLIEEKEKMSEKYREENSWLRTQIIELKNELSILRGEIIAETNNRAKISDFLIESNKFWQERSVENLEKKNNFENNQKERRYDFNQASSKEDIKEIEARGTDTIYSGFWFGWLLMWVGIFLLVLVVFFYNFFFSLFL